MENTVIPPICFDSITKKHIIRYNKKILVLHINNLTFQIIIERRFNNNIILNEMYFIHGFTVLYFNNKYKILYFTQKSINIIDIDNIFKCKKDSIYLSDIDIDYQINHEFTENLYVMVNQNINLLFKTKDLKHVYHIWKNTDNNVIEIYKDYENKFYFIQANNSIILINLTESEPFIENMIPFFVININLKNFKELYEHLINEKIRFPSSYVGIIKCIMLLDIAFITEDICYIYKLTGQLIRKYNINYNRRIYSVRDKYIIYYNVDNYKSYIYDLNGKEMRCDGQVSDINDNKIIYTTREDNPSPINSHRHNLTRSTGVIIQDLNNNNILSRLDQINMPYHTYGIYESDLFIFNN